MLRETVAEFGWPRRGKNKVDADQRAGPRQAAVGRVSEPALFTYSIQSVGVLVLYLLYLCLLFCLNCPAALHVVDLSTLFVSFNSPLPGYISPYNLQCT